MYAISDKFSAKYEFLLNNKFREFSCGKLSFEQETGFRNTQAYLKQKYKIRESNLGKHVYFCCHLSGYPLHLFPRQSYSNFFCGYIPGR